MEELRVPRLSPHNSHLKELGDRASGSNWPGQPATGGTERAALAKPWARASCWSRSFGHPTTLACLGGGSSNSSRSGPVASTMSSVTSPRPWKLRSGGRACRRPCSQICASVRPSTRKSESSSGRPCADLGMKAWYLSRNPPSALDIHFLVKAKRESGSASVGVGRSCLLN